MEVNIEEETQINYLNNLGKEIVRECALLGINVTLELVCHIVKLKELNPKNNFSISHIAMRDVTHAFVRSCVEDLREDSPTLDCIRLQAYWHSNIPKLDEVVEVYNSQIAQKSDSAFKDLLETGTDDVDKMLKKMAVFINVHTNIGNSNTYQNMKETINPLKSVFKQRDLRFYLTLTDSGKLEYLKITSPIVSGIRIYQYYNNKGSDSVEGGPLRLSEAVAFIKNEATTCMEKIEERIDVLTEELIYLFELDPERVVKIPKGYKHEHLVEISKIHNTMLQHQKYLRKIITYIDDFALKVHILTEELIESIQELNRIINDREVIPTGEVYDQFTLVCEQWTNLRSESCFIILIELIMKTMQSINKYFTPTPLEVALDANDPKWREREDPTDYTQKVNTKKYSVVGGPRRSTIDDDEDHDVEFEGYCAWTLVEYEGLLIPLNPMIKILRYQDKFYGFYNQTFAEQWKMKPDRYILEALEIIRTNPEMVELLEMYDVLYKLKSVRLVSDDDLEKRTADQGAQTEIHPVEQYFDKEYSFSEWELKMKALKLSRIVKCVTKSMQTGYLHSHYRASIGIQCAPDKSVGVITGRDEGVVHETLNNYIWGLRDEDRSHFAVFSLTRPVDESFEKILPSEEKPCNEKTCVDTCVCTDKDKYQNEMKVNARELTRALNRERDKITEEKPDFESTDFR